MEQPQPSSLPGRNEESPTLHQDSKSNKESKKEEHGLLSSDDDDHSCSQESSHGSHSLSMIQDNKGGKPSSGLSARNNESSSTIKKYEACSWNDLPTNVQKAATRLGYTPEMWNSTDDTFGNRDPESSKKYWEELDAEEKEAAKILGYDEIHWDFGDKEVITPEDYDDMYWNQLPRHIRKAYRVLGYRKKLWNEDGAPASFDKDWFELNQAEQRAATIVGYTAETWDEEPEDSKPGSIKEGAMHFAKGSCYILLECVSMSAFLAVVKAFFSIGKQYLDGHSLGAVKIMTGLVIMEFSGQMHKWLEDEEEASDRLTRQGKRQEATLFRSFLNLFSWWAIFAGVDHFMDAFENDMLYNYGNSAWYLKLCEEPDNATLINATREWWANATQPGNTTLSFVKARAFHYADLVTNSTDKVEDFIIDRACEVLDDDHERMGPVFHWTVFMASAVSLWYAFEDNFLKGCDVH